MLCGNTEASYEATAVAQVRDTGGLDQGGNCEDRNVESQDMRDTTNPQFLKERYSENSSQILQYENITLAYDLSPNQTNNIKITYLF